MASAQRSSRLRDPLDGLDPEQRAAASAPRGPVCVLAGAGTGKTRTITRRIAYLVRQGHVAAGQVLAVTFTARAAGELRARLRQLGVDGAQARTFHAAALRQLRYFWPRVVGGEHWDLIDNNKLRLVGLAAGKLGMPTETEVLRDLAGEIEWAKACLVGPDDYPSVALARRRDIGHPAERVAEAYRTYEELKNDRRLLDFDDLLLHTTAALEEHRGVAEEFRDRYRCFVVDEYQDITPAQQRLLQAWLGGRDDVTVVGDVNQTIYSFGGASPRPLLDFTRKYPDATVVRLERDYRSTPQVVELANRVISGARGRPAGARLRLVGQRPDGPRPTFAEYDDEPTEAAAVARKVRDLVGAGVPAGEIAVLFRVNAQSETYERALADAGVPYQIRGGERFFARQEVRQAMTALRTAAAAQTGASATDLPTMVGQILSQLGWSPRQPTGGAARERWSGLQALHELAQDLEPEFRAISTDERPALARYVAELEQRAASQHPPEVDGVTLASLHAAKGLEWDAVFLVGLADGTVPIQHATTDDAVEEERRLFYVGVTRAREHLALSWSLSRTPGGRPHRRRSRFLHGLVPEEDAARSVRRPARHRAGSRAVCRVCGRALNSTVEVKLGRCADCPSDVDEELLERLRQWRGEKARELGVPAFVVFTDATLVAIAEQRPADVRGLVSISGIGATKVERFGEDVLTLLTEDVPGR
ncbi:ATP-dependent DNA helicase UvrD2 [Saccharomonospora xinjiangensis]|uniref:ATP-dependent DNA helicase UvrD2 n=1 Tax=Saccharomonospora xinjiangensis XJ-54 TaxID=882086 RepID=I0V041_9PSEU|nr:ATP-dependent DNA helicase UvrD2 [Saccharomonospora xinjiangensis]EID53494.1 DNA/RNA helicase, superfamily I [Saccharomonospora xinjiangensis XJ-54]